MTLNIYDLQDISVRPVTKKTSVIARADILIGGLRIHGIRIQKSQFTHPRFQEKIQIEPPSIPTGPYWMKVVYFEDKELWQAIEEKIYDEFRRLDLPYEPLMSVNPEEIPI